MEMADCQGSDAPNPAHLAKVQDYLLKTHLILYLISGRTGIREADIKLMSVLRTFRLLENTVFVLNLDLNEHDNLASVTSLTERVQKELEDIAPGSKVFALSALFDLFQQMQNRDSDSLSKKDRTFISVWQETPGLSTVMSNQSEHFQSYFTELAAEKKSSLTLKSGLEKLFWVAPGMNHFLTLSSGIRDRGAEEIKELSQKMTHRRESLEYVVSSLEHTLKGAVDKIKKELRNEVDRFFDVKNGQVVKDTRRFIGNFVHETKEEIKILQNSGGMAAASHFFRLFDAGLNRFLVEDINLQVVAFAGHVKDKVTDHMAATINPFLSLMQDSLKGYQTELSQLGLDTKDVTVLPNYEKDSLAFDPPPIFSATIPYDFRMKARVFIYSGLSKAAKGFENLIRKIFKTPEVKDGTNQFDIQFYRDATALIKDEALKEMSMSFMDFKENFKYSYAFKLIDNLAGKTLADLKNLSKSFVVDVELIGQLVKTEERNREINYAQIDQMNLDVSRILTILESLKAGIFGRQRTE
ncbi:MAG: hypothetical protein HQK57_07580 [Deltaproteobacteria bacterium]|nr:hypothetical protein [Deltaproteobacteria bacterium]